MVARDCSLAEIATALQLSEPTVRVHYAAELDAERPQLNFPFARIPRPLPSRRKSTARMGRPEHVPTEATRDRVEVLVAGGMRQWQIAAAIGVSVPTLCQHYADELENGRARKEACIIEALYKAGIEAGNVSALKAWLAQPKALDEDPARQPKPPAPGKKEAAIAAAHTAAMGTDWASLLPN